MSKGSKRRPRAITQDEYDASYERIFGGRARQHMEQVVAELDRRGEIPCQPPEPGDIIVHAND